MPAQGQAESHKPKRTSNACIACRQSKIKCSGAQPCANCQRRGVDCQFTDSNKVTVDERFLQRLLDQARGHPEPLAQRQLPSPASKRSADVAFGPMFDVDASCSVNSVPPHEDPSPYHMPPPQHERSVWTNPFTLPSKTVNGLYKGKRGWVWLAPTSLWSLTTRLSLMMADNLELDSPYRVPSSLDKEIYPLRWTHVPLEDPPDITGLPSIDDALYLFNTVKHHLDQHYRFFDDKAFTARLNEFYSGNSLEIATENRLWFVSFLLILAFGNAFLLRNRSPNSPPGSKFFVRAMSLIPDYTNLWTDGLLAVEVLALAGLYLYCIDHRESAHVYVGQAIRIAQLDGLHTELPEDELGTETVTRCRNLWWTLYVMDRHVSSSLGLPMTTQDSDITTLLKPASAGSRRDATLSLHVKLASLFSSILTSIYKNAKTELGTFLERTRSILQTMTAYAREIEDIVQSKNPSSIETMPKGTRYITLLYHQCVVVATRPLLLSILKERLERLGEREDDWQSFLAPTKVLISTGIKSALKTLQILSDENSLLETFLPFELEVTYGAALHLTMATTLFPLEVESQGQGQAQNFSADAHGILDEMIGKGNKLAAARKTELTHLESLFCELAARIERYGLQTLTLTTPPGVDGQGRGQAEGLQMQMRPPVDMPHMHGGDGTDSVTGTASIHAATMQAHNHAMFHDHAHPMHGAESIASPSGLPPHMVDGAELLSEIGISSYEFSSILEQMGGPERSILDERPPWMEGI
ncbi:fungal-specific transcription factor domain-containing protein [Aspergillus keveii]|uniref:Fungal-specific transcription factor domain-containing protein n=1 Tax=Aspergillus keveii TaxID=714993 RepID=A0ABR4G274_9EURO